MATVSNVGRQSKDFENAKARINDSSGNGSGPATKGSSATSSALGHRATGPRTRQGKEKSKHNAQKHGIFSKAILQRDEPRDEFESMINGLRSDIFPVGELEIQLVDKLGALLWRQRRVLNAERAEIQKNKESVKWDEEREHEERAAEILRNSTDCNGGLITTIENPKILEKCLELLAQLESGITQDGFNPECDKEILTKLYGEHHQEDLRNTLFDLYLFWLYRAHRPDEKRQVIEITSPEEAKQKFLHEIKQEENRLRLLKKNRAARELTRRNLVLPSRNIPTPLMMDTLLRYETTIDRFIERTLKQLERCQRRRLGQPLLPPIDVNLSLEE